MRKFPEKKQGKCLLLGGCGFIGSHVAEGLLESGYHLRIFDKRKVDTRNIDHILDSLELLEGDFRDDVGVAAAVKGMDYVFHFIGTTLPKTATDNPVYDLESNVIATLKLLEHASKAKIKKIIFPSSGGTVYGVAQSIPIAEDHPTNPTCAYGISKLMIEKYLDLFHLTCGLNYIVFRISNLYGERQNPHSIQGTVAVFLGLVKEKKPITIWGIGDTTRDYIYVKDIVPVLISSIQAKNRLRIYNLGTGKGTTLNELLTIIKKVTGREVEIRYSPKRTIDVPVNMLDIGRVQKEFAFFPTTSLTEGVGKTWTWLNQDYIK